MSIAREIVSFAMEAGSSDIHLEEESPIAVRVNSDIKVSPQLLDSEDMDQLLLELLGEEKLKEYNQTFDTENLTTFIKLSGLGNIIHIYPQEGLPLLIKSRVGNLGNISIYIKSKEQKIQEKFE